MTQIFERTLFVTRYYPVPAHTGALLYSSQLIRIIARLSAHVDVVCQIDPRKPLLADQEPGQDFPDNASFFLQNPKIPSLMGRVLSGLPSAAIVHATAENRERLDDLLKMEPECIVLDHIGSAWAYRQVKNHVEQFTGVKVVYCTHNFDRDTRQSQLYTPWRNPAFFLAVLVDLLRVHFYDRRLVRLSDVLTSISSVDEARYASCFKPARTVTVNPWYRGTVCVEKSIDASVPRCVCLSGSFVWSAKKKNLEEFLRKGYEIFASQGINLLVVGRMDSGYRDKLKARWPDVTFTGTVAKVERYLARARIGVIPEVTGGGFKLKSLEYIFNRVPIFAVEKAIIDLPLVAGKSIEVFSDIRSLCRGIAEKIDDVLYLNDMQKHAFDACSGFLSEAEQQDVLDAALRETCRHT